MLSQLIFETATARLAEIGTRCYPQSVPDLLVNADDPEAVIPQMPFVAYGRAGGRTIPGTAHASQAIAAYDVACVGLDPESLEEMDNRLAYWLGRTRRVRNVVGPESGTELFVDTTVFILSRVYEFRA